MAAPREAFEGVDDEILCEALRGCCQSCPRWEVFSEITGDHRSVDQAIDSEQDTHTPYSLEKMPVG